MPNLTPQQVEETARVMPDHTLATSFLAPDARARVIALIGFTHEIARARAVVSEAGLAAIRLQWWRDTIEQIYSGQVVRAQPTAVALAGAVREGNLPRALLDAMIDGYERELEATPFQTWTDLNTYLDATSGNLARLSLLAAGLPAITTGINAAAHHTGIAWGLAHLMATTPSWLERRCLWLPQQDYGDIDTEAVFAGQVSQRLRTVLSNAHHAIVSAQKQANQHLSGAVLGASFPALAHACLARSYAKAAIPRLDQPWQIGPSVPLLERQVRITISVARQRI